MLAGAGAIVFYNLVPIRYTARAEVWLDCPADDAAAPSLPGGDGIDQRRRRAAEATLLTSPAMVDRVVRDLAARTHTATADDAADTRVAAVTARLKVTGQASSCRAMVTYDDADSARAAEVANRLVAHYVADRRQNGARARRVRQAQGQADAAGQATRRAQAAAAAYRASADPAQDGDLRRLDGAAAALDARLASLRVREAAPVDAAAEPDAPASLASLQAQLVQLTAARTALTERYGPLHPDMIRMNNRVAALIDRVTATTNRLQAVTEAARRAHERLDEQATAAAARTQRQAVLDNAASLAAARYDQSLDELRRTRTVPPDRRDAHVGAPARLSSTSPLPDRSTLAAIAGLTALIAAGGIVAVRTVRAPGLHDAAAADRILGLPVIGLVPDVPPPVDAAIPGLPLADLILSDTAPDFVAAFRKINANLAINRPCSIAVTSAFESEGKTTVSIGIARLAAQSGLRVLLIDCDVRRPAATRALAPQATAYLADVLAGRTELARARVRDEASGAWFLPSGLAGAAELAANGLVGSEAMLDLIERARHDYDLVLLDMAPVLALAETRVAAAFAGRVLLVARWRTTPVKATRLALDLLIEAEAKVAALVLTRVRS